MGVLAKAAVSVLSNGGDGELIVKSEQRFIGIDRKKLLASVVVQIISSAFDLLGVIESSRGVS